MKKNAFQLEKGRFIGQGGRGAIKIRGRGTEDGDPLPGTFSAPAMSLGGVRRGEDPRVPLPDGVPGSRYPAARSRGTAVSLMPLRTSTMASTSVSEKTPSGPLGETPVNGGS